MKVLLDDLSADPELAERFMTEIRTLARLDHPNIAKLHTAFTVENRLVMIMELLEGLTLADHIKQGTMPLNQMLDFTAQTLSALAYAHQAGVVHRDVKPSNVMISPHGIVKLMDFGIAKSDTDHNQTRTGMTMGSMLYMSPEQVRGSGVDARSDIYSVGVMLYEMATGKRPFDAENTHAILEAQLNQMPAPLNNPALPPTLNDIIFTAMAKDPMHRFQSADAFRKALASLIPRPAAAGAAKASPQAAAGAPTVAQKSRRGLWMALGAVACICVLVGAAVTLPQFFGSHAASSKPSPVSAGSLPANPGPSPASTPAVNPPEPKTPDPSPVTNQPSEQPAPAPVVNPIQTPSPEQKEMAVSPRPKPIKPISKSAPPVQTHSDTPLPSPQSQAPPIQPQPQAQPVPAGPSPEQMEAANEDLMKLHSRADAVRGSLEHLRSEQAASGLNLNPSVTAGASRMENYLHASEQALQNNNLELAQKYMDRANNEITKLESFFGR
jgi:serine/threonine-protein kinase